MLKKREQAGGRFRRKRRIRKKVVGTTARPRMTVFRSNQEIYVQLVDDLEGRTIAAASSIDRAGRERLEGLDKTAIAREVGKLVAERALVKGVEKVVFDRNGFIYHGRVAAVAEGAREGGLQF
ncbi:MAG: 50S ribosomal protein L18 [Bradymonadaceae bacterium]